jgi:hypothetical protein
MKTIYLFLLIFVGLVCSPQLAKSQQKNIDCGCVPAIPAFSWTVISPKGEGTYLLDPANIKLVSFESKNSALRGGDIVVKTKDISLNACIFDYLFTHQELIPESWKTKQVAFPGTVFSDGGGNKFFRFLYWWDNRWNSGCAYLDESYDDKVVAVK